MGPMGEGALRCGSAAGHQGRMSFRALVSSRRLHTPSISMLTVRDKIDGGGEHVCVGPEWRQRIERLSLKLG